MTEKTFKSKISNIINPNSINLEEFSVCLFWDYENVPLSKENGENFLLALKSLFDNLNVVFSKLFIRKEAFDKENIELIKKTLNMPVNIIKDNTKNAVDRALINSLKSVRRSKKITHVILLTGDKDYQKAIIDTYKWIKKIILISRRKSTSSSLTPLIHTYYSIENLLHAPDTWWKRSIK